MSDYENITCPVTLVCAGNRRKEQNVVRKSKGFSWGPAGLSTALFTGVVMADVIRKAKPLRKAKYVCMEGADKLVSFLHDAHECANIHSPMVIMAPRSSSIGSWIPIEVSCYHMG
jgi:DMSO/TMAO reductase YedYZ molybdopterin-dependent catalytic subunit